MMTDVALSPGWFRIAELQDAAVLRDELLALEERQTRELIVNGLRGRWERTGGRTPEHAMMAPTESTRRRLRAAPPSSDQGVLWVTRPNDALDEEAFFTPLPPFESATPEERREAGQKLLSLAELGWRSTSPWYGDRGELYER